jgi:hypothetical protein
MRRARRQRRDESQNLDSLLDTMANVTGILVVLLAVTQISVGDAMARLREQLADRPELTREALALAEAEAAGLRNALAPLEPRQEELARARRERREDLAAMRTHNAEARADVATARATSTDSAALRRGIEASRRQARALEAQLATAQEELAGLTGALEEGESGPLRREARLPDPRRPPTGATEIAYLCRYGRIVRAHAKELLRALQVGTRDATGGVWAYGQGPPNFVDRSRMVAHFQANDVGTREFRWHVMDLGTRALFAQLEWRSHSLGESFEEVEAGRSEFNRDLLRVDPHRTYFRFFVWSDSFDVYAAARAKADEAGFAAGWVPFDALQPFRQDLIESRHQALID